MYRMLVGLLLLLATDWVAALSEGRLLSQSKSGRTVVFNLGTHDGIKEGDYAVIVKQIRGMDAKNLRMIPAAKARNVRVSTDSSIWILYHLHDPELMVTGQKFNVLTESNMLRGRRELKLGRTTIVAPKGKVAEVAKAAVSDDKDRLVKLEDYHVIVRTHEKELRSDNDMDLLDLEEWEKARGQRYRSALYRSPNKEEFRRAWRLDTFQKLVAAYLVRVNDPDFSYEKFYQQQMRDGVTNEFRLKTNFNNEYEDFLHRQSLQSSADARLYRSILEKGESWSEDFSDEELRKVLGSVSVLHEQERRKTVVFKPTRYSFNFDYGFPLNQTQTEDDTRYRREGVYSLAIDFEATPFLKHETLERFTFNASARTNRTAFNNDGSNVSLNELSAALGVNWYPLYSPYVVEAPLLFFGTYLRSGYGTVAAPIQKEEDNYTILSFPGIRLGMKYIFRNNLGLRMVASMETLQLEKYGSSKLGSSLPDKDALTEASLAFGLAYSF